MSRQIVASRYAEALFALAQEQDLIAPVERDLTLLANTLAEHQELDQVLQHRRIESRDKYSLLEELFGKEFHELTLNFLGVLLEKRREGYLADIITGFRREVDLARGILEAEIRTAVELPPEGKEALAAGLTKATGKEMRFEYRVEPELVAGAVLRIGDKVIDGSIATRLKRLHAELSG